MVELCKLFKEKLPQPRLKEYSMSNKEMDALLHSAFPKAQLMLWDKNYYYTTMEDWSKIFEDVLLNMPKYTTDKFDCENIAMLVSARVSSKYKLNTCALVVNTLWSHAFNVFVAEDKEVHILEGATGEVDLNYTVGFLIMG